MTFPIIAAATALAPLVPDLYKWLMPGASGGNKNNSYEVATKVIDIAKKVSGNKDTESAVNALKNNPHLLLQFQESFINLERELIRTQSSDRESARKRDITMLELGHSNFRADIMVMAAALGLVVCLLSLSLFQGELPGEAVGIISTVAGIFGACLKDAYAFEFGSSRGSKSKDLPRLIEELRQNS